MLHFLWLNNSPVRSYATFYLPIYQLVDIEVFSLLWYEHSCTHFLTFLIIFNYNYILISDNILISDLISDSWFLYIQTHSFSFVIIPGLILGEVNIHPTRGLFTPV